MKRICLITVIVFLVINCQNVKQAEAAKSSSRSISTCISKDIFNKNDTVGTFRGPIAVFVATTDFVNIGLLGKNGDTILFMGNPSEIKNYDSLRLSVHPCVEISYRAKILQIEGDGSVDGNPGDETERDFYIKEIKYL
jgi:hypothetical protein